MVKNVNIEKDISIKMNFDSFYELNKEYESPYYTLKNVSIDGIWSVENPVNFSFYPPKNATKLILELKNLDAYRFGVEPRAPELYTYSYMRVKFPDIGSIDIRQGDNAKNNPYEYILKDNISKLDIVIEEVEVYLREGPLKDQRFNFLFTFK